MQLTACFWHCFCVFWPAWGLICLLQLCPPPPMPRHSPRQYSAHQAVFEPPSQYLALSKWRRGASIYSCGMRSSLPLSHWLPGESYMTPSRMATSLFTAIRIRVKSLFYVLHASGAMAAAVLPAYAAQAVILVIATAQVVIPAATDNSRCLGNPTHFPLLLQLAAPSSPPTRPSPQHKQHRHCRLL